MTSRIATLSDPHGNGAASDSVLAAINGKQPALAFQNCEQGTIGRKSPGTLPPSAEHCQCTCRQQGNVGSLSGGPW
jgi:hypothetical protein